MIKILAKGMRYCLEHYLDENKVVSVIDGQTSIAVGEGEKKNSESFILLTVTDASRYHKEGGGDTLY